MYFSSHLSDKQYFLSQKIDKNVVYLATTEDRSGLTRQELQCVVTRNETLSGYRNCIAFMANLGPLSAPMATWNSHSRSENWFQQVGLDVCYPVPALFQAVPPIQGHHGCLWPEHCIYGHFWHFLAIKWVKMAGTRKTCFGSRFRSTQMTT